MTGRTFTVESQTNCGFLQILEHWVSSTAAFLKTKNTEDRDNKMFCSANDSFSFLKLIFF